MVPNETQLRKLLLIPQTENATIYGIIGRMEVLLDYFQQEKRYHTLLPFLKTYYFVTKASAEKYITHRHYFWRMRDHEILDIYFASLYFQPLLAYIENDTYHHPWEQYFRYCDDPKGIPFLQVLLGINAHINTDLYLALVKLRYRNQKDYFLVNDILLDVVPKVMQYLALNEHDVLGWGGVIWKDFMVYEFHKIIEKWRSEAWINAKLTTPKNEKEMYKKISQKTEKIGEVLTKDFNDLYRLKNVAQLRSDLDSLSSLTL